ncbi:MAG: hypothetical protein JRI25_25275 [Deltaproteobacteria bacterium]|nr:hypothetical protein [Deltaproteobacteria bacterium]
MDSTTGKLILVAAVAGLLGGVGGGLIVKSLGKPDPTPAPFRIVSATRLKLVDTNKRVCLEMWTNNDGAVLVLNDPSLGDARRPRVQLHSAQNASLDFYDTKGMLRARIGMGKNDTPVLALFDAKGKAVWKAP